MNARELYDAGRLQEAISAQSEEVKRHPTDTSLRGFLCELLCFTGELDRVDPHLEMISKQDLKSAMGVSLFRQLLRAERARQQFYSEGRVPEFLDQPTEPLRLHLEASIRLREGNTNEAAELLGRAEQERPKVAGVCDGQPFDELRDLDDLTASFFEVLTSTGKYYWIPMERVDVIEFRPPARPRDLLWRRAHMVVQGGPDGEVYLPTLYAGSHAEAQEQIRLGRVTEWRGGNGAPVRGLGQRILLIGAQDRSLLELQTLSTGDQPPPATA